MSSNPHISVFDFAYHGSCMCYLISKRFDPKIFGTTDISVFVYSLDWYLLMVILESCLLGYSFCFGGVLWLLDLLRR